MLNTSSEICRYAYKYINRKENAHTLCQYLQIDSMAPSEVVESIELDTSTV